MAETAKKEDKYITMISPAGTERQVWDFGTHVERLLAMGWKHKDTKPAATKPTTKPDKEQ